MIRKYRTNSEEEIDECMEKKIEWVWKIYDVKKRTTRRLWKMDRIKRG